MIERIYKNNQDTINLKDWLDLGVNKGGSHIYAAKVHDEYDDKNYLQFLVYNNDKLLDFFPCYYPRTLLDDDALTKYGLCLNGNYSIWNVSSKQMKKVVKYLKE